MPAVGQVLERAKGFEPSTPTLARSCSTPELHPHPLDIWPKSIIGRQGRSYSQKAGLKATRAKTYGRPPCLRASAASTGLPARIWIAEAPESRQPSLTRHSSKVRNWQSSDSVAAEIADCAPRPFIGAHRIDGQHLEQDESTDGQNDNAQHSQPLRFGRRSNAGSIALNVAAVSGCFCPSGQARSSADSDYKNRDCRPANPAGTLRKYGTGNPRRPLRCRPWNNAHQGPLSGDYRPA